MIKSILITMINKRRKHLINESLDKKQVIKKLT